jgi:hypothetical protein
MTNLKESILTLKLRLNTQTSSFGIHTVCLQCFLVTIEAIENCN